MHRTIFSSTCKEMFPFIRLFLCLFIFEIETEHEQRKVERERETQNPEQAPGSELSAQSLTRGSNSRAVRS